MLVEAEPGWGFRTLPQLPRVRRAIDPKLRDWKGGRVPLRKNAAVRSHVSASNLSPGLSQRTVATNHVSWGRRTASGSGHILALN